MTECDPEELKGEQSIQAKVEPVLLPETILPVPDELREPTGGIEGLHKEPEKEVTPLLLKNHPITLTCEENNTYGDAVTIEEGAVTEQVYFSRVPSIPANVLTYIAENELERWIEEEWHNGRLNSTVLHERTGMTVVQARQLLQTLRSIQENLDRIVKQQAESMLQCHWCSNPQTAVCVDPAMARSGTYNGEKAVYTYTVAACAVKSFISQADADARALDLAESMLNCFYINDQFTATCETRPDRPLENMEPVPNDTTPIYPGRSLRVGRYVISSGSVVSRTSKEDANDQAQAIAFSMLNCWYPNWPTEASCDPDEETGEILARNMWVDPAKEPIREANIIEKTTGQVVNIPAGFFTSEVSSEEANQEAEDFATSLLECCFINDEMEFRCDTDVIYDTENCKYEDIQANPKKGKTYLKVEKGTFASCISKEEANMFAQQSAEGQLQCIYCNLEILPTCVPDWVMEGVLNGDLTLPLSSDTISYNGHSIKTESLPPEATLGAAAGDYCASEAQQAQAMASSAAKARGSNACLYFNDEVLIACSAGDPYNPLEDVEGMELYHRIHPETGEAYYLQSLYDPGKCMSPLSVPVVSDYIMVPAGLFSGPDKRKVDAEAIDFGAQQRSCMWQNPETLGFCGGQMKLDNMCGPWEIGKDLEYPQQRLHPFSHRQDTPLLIPEGFFTRAGIGGDELSVCDEIRKSVRNMTSTLMCVYGNESQFATCAEVGTAYEFFDPNGPGLGWEKTVTTVPMHDGFVPSMFVYAETPAAADEIAEGIAKTLAACDKNTTLVYHCILPTPEPSPSPTPTPTPSGPGPGPGPTPPVPSGSPTPTPVPTPTLPIPTPSQEDDSHCWWNCPLYKRTVALDPNPPIKRDENNPMDISLQDRIDDLNYRITAFINER